MNTKATSHSKNPKYSKKYENKGGKFERMKRDSRITNDFSFYNKYPTLITNAGEFPFNHIRGTQFEAEGYASSLPVVTVLDYYPTIGECISPESAFNTQIRSLWLDMHRKYRGIGTYESADLGAFIFCTIDFFADIARAEKIYGYFRGAQATNRAIPYTLLAGVGVDYNQNARALSNFRSALNEINVKASTICLPKGFSALSDAVVLATATVKDSESQRAGLYTFNKEIFYTFSGTAYSTGSACIAHNRTYQPGAQFQFFDDIIHDLQTQLSVLLDDSDCQRMASDILAAYGENGVETRQAVTEESIAPIGKDDVRLLQIHNATLVGGTSNNSTRYRPHNVLPTAVTPIIQPTDPYMDIVQVNNCLIESLSVCAEDSSTASETFNAAGTAYFPECQIPYIGNNFAARVHSGVTATPVRVNDRVLDTWVDNPSLEDKVEMSRFTVPAKIAYLSTASGTTVGMCKLLSYGAHIITGCTVFSKDSNSGLQAHSAWEIVQSMSAVSTGEIRMTQFDWHPILYIGTVTVSSATPGAYLTNTNTELLGDIDHCVAIKDDSLIMNKMHDACMMSEYRCELTATSKFDLT